MAISESEIQKAKDLKAQGYSNEEILGFLGADRLGMQSPVHKELKTRQTPQQEPTSLGRRLMEIGGAPAGFLIPEAVDIFGSDLARQGFGPQTREQGQADIEEPTNLQRLGAGLQTAGLAADVGLAVGSFGATTPLTLGKNVAIGAGLGYVYDVGEDLAEQESLAETIDPDLGTFIGGAAPIAFAGLGAGVRALKPAQEVGEQVADDAGRALARPTTQAVGDTFEDALGTKITGAKEQARSLAQRIPRAISRTDELLEENAKRAELRQNGSPAMQTAIDDGLDTKTITRITDAPDFQKQGYREVVLAAESADPRNAEAVAGKYATDMYKNAVSKQKEIGKQLGEAREALGTKFIPFKEDRRTLMNVLSNNGIQVQPNGSVKFTKPLLDEEKAVIEKIWGQISNYDSITPQQVNELDQFLSKLERRSHSVDRIESIYINVPEAQTGQLAKQNLFRYIRDTFDNKLAEVDTTGQIRDLKRQYAQLKTTTSNIEGTWYNGLDLRNSTDEDLAQRAALALRRVDGRAQSGVTYNQMYRNLNLISRANYNNLDIPAYAGPDALDVSNFYIKEVEPLYRETTPPASITGIFGGVRQTIADALNVGGVENIDKQRALKGLLEIGDEAPVKAPTAPVKEAVSNTEDLFVKRGIIERAGEALKDQRGALNPNRTQAGSPFGSSVNFNKLSEKGETQVSKFLRHVNGEDQIKGDEFRQVMADIQDIADNAGLARAGNESNEVLAKRIADKYDIPFNQPATAQTTDYVYHATNPKNLESIRKEGLKTGNYGSLYLAPTEEGISGYGGGKPAKIRVKRENLPDDYVEAYGEYGASDLGEIKTKQNIPPEALEIFENGKWQPVVSESTDLLSQAKGKTLDEFVEGQGEPLYRGSKTDDLELNNIGELDFSVNKSVAQRFAEKSDNGIVSERFLSPQAKMLDPSKLTNEQKTGILEYTKIRNKPQFDADDVLDYAKNNNYDAVDFTKKSRLGDSVMEEITVLNPKVIKTRSQLEDIWKQANK